MKDKNPKEMARKAAALKKQDRLAEALRENLRKRKSQGRSRRETPPKAE